MRIPNNGEVKIIASEGIVKDNLIIKSIFSFLFENSLAISGNAADKGANAIIVIAEVINRVNFTARRALLSVCFSNYLFVFKF